VRSGGPASSRSYAGRAAVPMYPRMLRVDGGKYRYANPSRAWYKKGAICKREAISSMRVVALMVCSGRGVRLRRGSRAERTRAPCEARVAGRASCRRGDRDGQLGELRVEIEKTRERAWGIFNQINSSNDFDVLCGDDTRTFLACQAAGLRQPRFEGRITSTAAKRLPAALAMTCPANPATGFINFQECMTEPTRHAAQPEHRRSRVKRRAARPIQRRGPQGSERERPVRASHPRFLRRSTEVRSGAQTGAAAERQRRLAASFPGSPRPIFRGTWP
jgi:hypothetical protein